MAEYAKSDYRLSIPFDFSKLTVTRLSDDHETEYDLSTETQVTATENSYLVELGALEGEVHEKNFNPDEDLDPAIVPNPFRFNDNDWIGSGDLRDMGRVTEYHYNLQDCDISFHYLSETQIVVNCRCKGECSGPTSCFEIHKVPLS